jgi:uncharacterized protein (DUF433 family)
VQAADVAHPFVERHPDVQGGQPVITGSRSPVSSIVQNSRRSLSVDDTLLAFAAIEGFTILTYNVRHVAKLH